MSAFCKLTLIFLALVLKILAINSKPDTPEPRIQGTTWTNNYLAMYIVSIRRKHDNLHFCGGSIITDLVVLTAAHCTFDETNAATPRRWNPREIGIVAGSKSILNNDLYQQARDVWQFKSHENYKNNRSDADIALIVVMYPFYEDNRYVQRIPLKFREPDYTRWYVAYGWGSSILESFMVVDNLRYAFIFLAPQELCLSETILNVPKYGTICSRMNRSGTDPGDSGGPLITYPGPHEQIGVIAFGYMGGRSYYTSVSYFGEWIKTNVHKAHKNVLNNANRKMISTFLVALTLICEYL